MDEKEIMYKNIGKIYCPYFKEYVYFTRIGLEHLKFKNKNKARILKDQIMRFKLLPMVVKILNDSHTLQDKSFRQNFEYRYMNNRKELTLTYVKYFEFIAIIDNKKLKVVIKQAINNEKIFLSVIPLFNQKMSPVKDDIL